MTASVLSGRKLAATKRSRVTAQAAGLTAAGVKPRLAIVTATDDASCAWYVRSLSRTAANVGITCDVVDLGADAATDTTTSTLRVVMLPWWAGRTWSASPPLSFC